MILLKYHFPAFHQQRSVHTLEGHPLDSSELRGFSRSSAPLFEDLGTRLCIEGQRFEGCTGLAAPNTPIQTGQAFGG